MRRISHLLFALALVLLVAAPAAAQSTSDAADGVEFRGYYVEDGAPASVNDMEAVANRYRSSGFGFVALSQTPSGGADLFADQVADLSGVDTIIVVTPDEFGYVSGAYSESQLSDALDGAFDVFDRSYADGFDVFAGELASVPVATTVAGGNLTTPTVAPTSGSGSSGGGFGFLIFLAVVGGVIWFFWRRGKKKREAAEETKIAALKEQIRKELQTAANEILDLEARVMVAENSEASEYFAAGSQGYAEFQDELDRATTFEEIHELDNKVDKTLWQLDAAEALIEGRDVPPEPEPEPFPEPEPETPTSGTERRPDLPPDLDMRRPRTPTRYPSSYGRSRRRGGSMGGLGSIAVILGEMMAASQRSRSGRRTGFGTSSSRSSRSSGRVNVPTLPSGRRSGSRRSTSRSGSRRSSGSRSRSRSRSRGRRSR